jgi:hypothetical protein
MLDANRLRGRLHASSTAGIAILFADLAPSHTPNPPESAICMDLDNRYRGEIGQKRSFGAK